MAIECDTEIPAFNAPCSGTPSRQPSRAVCGRQLESETESLVTYGLRYVRDTGRTDSDLPPLPGVQ